MSWPWNIRHSPGSELFHTMLCDRWLLQTWIIHQLAADAKIRQGPGYFTFADMYIPYKACVMRAPCLLVYYLLSLIWLWPYTHFALFTTYYLRLGYDHILILLAAVTSVTLLLLGTMRSSRRYWHGDQLVACPVGSYCADDTPSEDVRGGIWAFIL